MPIGMSNSGGMMGTEEMLDYSTQNPSSAAGGSQPNQPTVQEAAAVLDQLVNGSSSRVGENADNALGAADPRQALQMLQGLFNDLTGDVSSAAQGVGGLLQGLAGASGGAATAAPAQSGEPQPTDKRPAGDTRSADQIVDDNPTLKNLGNQEQVKDNLKKQCGNWEDPNLPPDQRADAAYRASEVLNYIKTSKASDGSDRSQSVQDDGKIDGFTKDGDARHGTEAGLLKDFGEQGYGALKANHSLDTTSDTHVNKDGTNKDNLQWGLEQTGHVLLKGVSAFEHIASQALGFVGDLKIPGISQLAALGSVATEAIGGGADVADTALEGGDVKKAAEQAGIDLGEQAFSALTVPGAGKAIGEGAKAGIEVAKRAAKEGAKQAGEGAVSDNSPVQS